MRARTRVPKVILLAAVLLALVALIVAIISCQAQSNGDGQGSQGLDIIESSDNTSSAADATDADTGDTASQSTDSELSPLRSEEERKATSTSDNTEKPGRKVVYLTFDDGPSTETHNILEILDEYGIHATWFVIGNRGHLEYVQDIWAAGHQVALHSYTHEYDEDYASVDAYFDGLDKLAEDVEGYLGFKPTLFRFPGGSVNGYNKSIREGLFAEAAERNWHYFDWNVGSGDAAGNNVAVSKILSNIKSESEGNNSCCVLMHDTEAKETTVEALPQIIEYYISQGWTFDVLTADSYGYHF